MTLTLGCHKSSCTHLFDYMFQISPQRLQKFLANLSHTKKKKKKKSQYKRIRSQNWPCRKIRFIIHYLNKVGSIRAANAAYQLSRSSAFWFQRFLKFFYHIWAWRPSWSCDQDHLNKISFPHPIEAPYEIWLWLAQWFLRRRCLKSVVDDGRRRPTYPISSPILVFLTLL